MNRAPKQWVLTKSETINSFESWKENLVYTLSLDPNFSGFLIDGVTWGKKSKANPLRGFTNDVAPIPVDDRRTAAQKVSHLELMLGQIANFCPVISRNSIVKSSTSISNIWQSIRLHFGFQTTGGHLLDFADIHLGVDERPEDLYQRLTSFIEDNLLKVNAGITHHGEIVTEDEELAPTLENVVILTWLRLIHQDLPKLVRQRYGTELRSRTLASIKPEISQALDSLLDEIHTNENSKVLRSVVSIPKPHVKAFSQRQTSIPNRKRVSKVCPLCKEADRKYDHFLSECKYLPEQDRKYIVRARQIMDVLDTDDCEYDSSTDTHVLNCTLHPDNPTESTDVEPITNRIQVRQSPYIDTFYKHHSARITIDSGATGNMVSVSVVKRFGVDILQSSQSARQADGCSQLKVVGETRLVFTRNNMKLHFNGLVIENLDVDILAGTPFMEENDIAIRPAKREVIFSNGQKYIYGSQDHDINKHTVRRTDVIRAPAQSATIWPGEFVELSLPTDIPPDSEYALEPHCSEQNSSREAWLKPDIISSVAGKIRIPNLTNEPQTLKRNEHLCQVRPVFIPDDVSSATMNEKHITHHKPETKRSQQHSVHVKLDPDHILPLELTSKFRNTLDEYDSVFDPNFKGYNGASGPFEAKVNMGPVQPPQRKGRLPQYARNQLVELQEKFDTLESQGVFKRPEDINVSVEYLNPSFLVKKSNGGHRLVTAFSDVARYSKPQPSLLPDVDATLRHIAQWKYIICTDLTSAFYQIPLAKDSMKYCGVCTPFRGVRVYVRSAMGMPGSETALEELLSRVIGHLVQEGIVAKIADDAFIGGDTPNELLMNFRKFLHSLHINGIHLSAPKTVIAPKRTTILGWIWSLGTLQASPHRIATLSTCKLPETVKDLRSFIGAYKVLARVIPKCASILSEFDNMTAGKESKEKLQWSDECIELFSKAQRSLSTHRSITLPRVDDILWIVTDGAFRDPGLGATLYVTRAEKLHVAGFFSAKLRDRQSTWLPCEVEALAIATAIKHFSPYIVQSKHTAHVLSDSKPCVQAFEKLCRGEFSASPRVSTFLSVASRYMVSIRHVSGSSIPQSDFASRNAPECKDTSCQICTFVRQTEDSVVRRTPVSVSDVVSGKTNLPFTTRSTWHTMQSECPDLRRTRAHLKQGTRPSKKVTNVKDIKRYLHSVTIAKDGLLVVPNSEPLAPFRERIVVPRQVLEGLLTALHIQLNHPSAHQLKQVTHRYFFALDLDSAAERISDSCHVCASLRKTPHLLVEQSTSDPPDAVGNTFAADVIRRCRQMIFVLRECVTSYTVTTLVDDERQDTLRNALIRSAVELIPRDGPPVVIRTDPAPAFQALSNDKSLAEHRIALEIGRIKNLNKNPVAEKAVQEVELELVKSDPSGGPVSLKTLAVATANLNARVRSRGLSAREMLMQRDQFTNSQLNLSDFDLISNQHEMRKTNHAYSEKSKAPRFRTPSLSEFCVGDLVYLYRDGKKTSPRDRYLVVSIDGNWCNIRKLVGSQLRNASYRVKMSECYKVQSQTLSASSSTSYKDVDDNASDDDHIHPDQIPLPPVQPDVPCEIATIPDTTAPCIRDEQQTAVNDDTPPRRSSRQRKQTQFYGFPTDTE